MYHQNLYDQSTIYLNLLILFTGHLIARFTLVSYGDKLVKNTKQTKNFVLVYFPLESSKIRECMPVRY